MNVCHGAVDPSGIRNNSKYVNIRLLVRASVVYVRPLLEYKSVTWSPHLKQDITRIEKVQQRFTKTLPYVVSKTWRTRSVQPNSTSQVWNYNDYILTLFTATKLFLTC